MCPSIIFPSGLLWPAIGCSAGSSSFEGKITKGDNFLNHGGKHQCIYMQGPRNEFHLGVAYSNADFEKVDFQKIL